MQLDREDWIRHVGLVLGFTELPEQVRMQLDRLASLRYTDRAAAEFMRKQLGVDYSAHNTSCQECDEHRG